MEDRDIREYVEALLQSHKEYLDTRLDSSIKESIMRFERMMQLYDAVNDKLETSVKTAKDDRERILETMGLRFDAQEQVVLLLDQKNQVHFSANELSIQKIVETYAIKENIERSIVLAKQTTDAQFEAARREREETNLRSKEVVNHLMQIIDRSGHTARERVDSAIKQMDAHAVAQAQATFLAAQTVDLRFTGIDKATAIANASLDKRLESMNEFRNQLREQAAKFVTREETEVKIRTFEPVVEAIKNRISELEKTKANGEGRIWAFGVVITFISIGISILLHFLH